MLSEDDGKKHWSQSGMRRQSGRDSSGKPASMRLFLIIWAFFIMLTGATLSAEQKYGSSDITAVLLTMPATAIAGSARRQKGWKDSADQCTESVLPNAGSAGQAIAAP
jgi:hypothetical protein